MSDKKPCGPHTELAKSEGARITRCACGAVHMHLSRSGVTVQLSSDHFEELGHVVALASRALAGAAPREVSEPTGTGETHSVLPQGRFIGVKKPTLN